MTRVGPAGWSYKDWRGIVYPAERPCGFHELAFLTQYFNTVEINVTFYRPLPPSTSIMWSKRIEPNPAFRFTAKLWRGFTHDRNATAQDEKEFKEGIAPLLEAGRLGALLLQFPWSFRNTPENREYVAAYGIDSVNFRWCSRCVTQAGPNRGCSMCWRNSRSDCATSISRCSNAPLNRLGSRPPLSDMFACMAETTRAGLKKTATSASAMTTCTHPMSLSRGSIASSS